MDRKTKDYFDDIISLAKTSFENVTFQIDVTPRRAILKIKAKFGELRIFITELISDGKRKYRYYALHGDWVVAGFDNSSDPRAIRIKYGKIDNTHVGKLVPHLHLENKKRLLLTEDIDFQAFLNWLYENENHEK